MKEVGTRLRPKRKGLESSYHQLVFIPWYNLKGNGVGYWQLSTSSQLTTVSFLVLILRTKCGIVVEIETVVLVARCGSNKPRFES